MRKKDVAPRKKAFYYNLKMKLFKFRGVLASALGGNIKILKIERLGKKYPNCKLHVIPEVYSRVKPVIFDQNEYIKKTEIEFHKNAIISPEVWVHEIDNAYVAHEGMVITFEGSLIYECIVNREKRWIFDFFVRFLPGYAFSFYDLNSCETRVTERAAILSQYADENYGHWLVESLPRLLLIRKVYDISTLKIILINRNEKINKVYIDSLSFLGVNPENIIWYDRLARVDKVVYASQVTVHPWIKSKICVEALEEIRDVVINGGAAGAKKLYISRNSDSSDRQLVNETEITEIVKQYGYDVVSCGDLDLEGQVRLFSGATHIVGNLGAGFTNLAFSPRGVRILALMSPLMPDDFFYDLVSLKDGHYWAIHGDGCGIRPNYRDDFTIDKNRFLEILDQFETDTSPSTVMNA